MSGAAFAQLNDGCRDPSGVSSANDPPLLSLPRARLTLLCSSFYTQLPSVALPFFYPLFSHLDVHIARCPRAGVKFWMHPPQPESQYFTHQPHRCL
jgi:hypothetical protein